MQKTCFLFFLLLFSATFSVRAEMTFAKGNSLLGVSGYARVFTGKADDFPFDFVLKSQAGVRFMQQLTPDIAVGAFTSVRLIRNAEFSEQNKTVFYETYLTLSSNRWGTLKAGRLKNVAQLMHPGNLDVGMLDIDDSDLGFFYDDPDGFYAPCMTYLGTDARDTKINYQTPVMAGWQAGLSAVQSEDKKYDTIAPGVKIDHGKGLISALTYTTKINDFEATLLGGFAYYHDDRFRLKTQIKDASHTEYNAALTLRRNDWGVAASYRQIRFLKTVHLKPSHAYGASLAYEPAPWGISVGFFNSSAESDIKNRFQNITVSAKYDLTRWLKVAVSGGRLTFKGENNRHNLFAVLSTELKL